MNSNHKDDPFLDSNAEDAELFDSLRSLHQAPLPRPAFVSTLRGELMAQASTVQPKKRSGIAQVFHFEQLAAPLPPQTRKHHGQDRRWIVAEIAAIALLMIGFLGTVLAGGPNGMLSALRQSPNEQSGPTALYRGDNARTGVMPETGPAELPSVIWRKQLTNANLWPSLATSGRIYMVDADGGSIQSVSTRSGMPIWGAMVGRMEGMQSIAVANGFVYVSTAGQLRGGSDAGYLIALDQTNGQEQWRYETGGTSGSSPTVDDGIVYIVTLDNSLRAIDAKSGKEQWRYDIASESPSASSAATAMAEGTPEAAIPNLNGFLSSASPAIADGKIYVTANDGTLYAVDLATHQESWRFASDGNVLSTPAIVDGVVYLPGWGATDYEEAKGSPEGDLPDGVLYAINASTGAEQWRWTGADYIEIVAVSGGSIYFTNDEKLISLSTEDEAPEWSVTSGFFAPILANGIIYVLDQTGTINAYEANGGLLLWQAYTAGQMPISSSGMLIMRDANSALLAIGEGSGTPLAKGSSSTPIATPEADLSGLAACDAPTPKASTTFSGTPTVSLIPERKWEHIGQPADALLSEVPTGAPVSAEIDGEILRTLRQMATCRQDGRAGDLSGFYSDDFFRRVWVSFSLEHNPDNLRWWLPEDSTYDSIRLLPDGRVGVLWMSSDTAGHLDIFTKEGDRWVIDESIAITENVGAVG